MTEEINACILQGRVLLRRAISTVHRTLAATMVCLNTMVPLMNETHCLPCLPALRVNGMPLARYLTVPLIVALLVFTEL